MQCRAERWYLNQALMYATDFIELYSARYFNPSPVVLYAECLPLRSSHFARNSFSSKKSMYFLSCVLVRFAFVSSPVFPMPPFAASRIVAMISGLLRFFTY